MSEYQKKPETIGDARLKAGNRPVVAIGAIVFCSGKVLLIKRGKPPKKEKWSLPGGAQKLGETLHEALVREVYEETGIIVTPGPLVDAVDFIERDSNQEPLFHYTLVDYAADAAGGTLKAGTDAIDAKYFCPDELDDLDLWDETKRVIERAIQLRGTDTTGGRRAL